MKKDEHINDLAKAYDQTVEDFKHDIHSESHLSAELKNSKAYKSLQAEGEVHSGLPEIKEFLNPQKGMRFLDVGSCANLFSYDLDKWESEYYGVDISSKLIEAMKKAIASRHLKVGNLLVADVANLPFEDSYFDIAAVIGVLEYYDLKYIEKALAELHRVLKNNARIVIDMPNYKHPYVDTMFESEKQQGRKYAENLPTNEQFEEALKDKFILQRKDDSRVMSLYFLNVQKQ